MSQNLQDYIAQARKVGKSDEEIVKGLLDKGWKHEDVQVVLSKKQDNSSQKTSLSQILIILGLYIVVVIGIPITFIASWGGVGDLIGLLFVLIPSVIIVRNINLIISHNKPEATLAYYALSTFIYLAGLALIAFLVAVIFLV